MRDVAVTRSPPPLAGERIQRGNTSRRCSSSARSAMIRQLAGSTDSSSPSAPWPPIQIGTAGPTWSRSTCSCVPSDGTLSRKTTLIAIRRRVDLARVARDLLGGQVGPEVMDLAAVARADHRRHEQPEFVPLARQRGEHDRLAARTAIERLDDESDMLAHAARHHAFLRDREASGVPALTHFAQQRFQHLVDQPRGRQQRDGERQRLLAVGSRVAFCSLQDAVDERRRGRYGGRDALRTDAAIRPARTRPSARVGRWGGRAPSLRAAAATAGRPPGSRAGGPGRRAAGKRCGSGAPRRGASRR